jgi:hypothetical protein
LQYKLKLKLFGKARQWWFNSILPHQGFHLGPHGDWVEADGIFGGGVAQLAEAVLTHTRSFESYICKLLKIAAGSI